MIRPEHEDVVRHIEAHVSHRFSRPDLAVQALTHSSAKEADLPCNERLEFLGDSIIGQIVSEFLFERFPQYEEGDLSTMKSVIVSAKTLAEIARELEMERDVILGRGLTEKRNLPRSILCNAFEALIAALYLDAGMDLTRRFVLDRISPKVEQILKDEHEKNYKSILQNYAQRNLSTIPTYRVMKESGPDHKKMFQVVVELNVKTYGPAWGANKKDAEQMAARQALEALGVLPASADDGTTA
ncbi:MAG: ribonuclease III [Planctomycetes bacterium]|nr:ribonuclease III [Planctomycetota bacterium]